MDNIYEATAFRGLAVRSHPSMSDLLQEHREMGAGEVLSQPPTTTMKTSQSAKDLQDLIQSALDVMTDAEEEYPASASASAPAALNLGGQGENNYGNEGNGENSGQKQNNHDNNNTSDSSST